MVVSDYLILKDFIELLRKMDNYGTGRESNITSSGALEQIFTKAVKHDRQDRLVLQTFRMSRIFHPSSHFPLTKPGQYFVDIECQDQSRGAKNVIS